MDRQCEFVNTGRGIRLQKSDGGNYTVSKLLEEIKLQHRLIPELISERALGKV